jgi:hypothetical protein
MPKGKGHDVVCPQCRESCHETTKYFKPNKDADGIMLKNKREFTAAHDQAWDEPIKDGGYGVLICLLCGSALAPSGRLEVRLKEGTTPPSGPPVEDKEPEPNLPTDEVQEVKTEPVLICPKCHKPVIVAEGDKGAMCLTHGEITLEELMSAEPSVDKPSGSFSMESVIKSAQEAETNKWPCEHPGCDKGPFQTKANLGSHMRVHRRNDET